MKILFISQSFYPHVGGVSTHLWTLGRYLSSNHEVCVCHLLGLSNQDAYEYIHGMHVYRVPTSGVEPNLWQRYSRYKEHLYLANHNLQPIRDFRPVDLPDYLAYQKLIRLVGREIYEIIRSDEFDIIHLHDYQLLEIVQWLPPSIPRIISWHSPLFPTIQPSYWRYLSWHLNQFQKIVFMTEHDMQVGVKLGLPRSKVTKIHPITDTDRFYPDEQMRKNWRQRMKLDGDYFVITCIQRIDAKSGHEQLLLALPNVVSIFPNTRVVIVGATSMTDKMSNVRQIYRQKIYRLIDHLNIHANVVITDSVTYECVPEIYAGSDVIAHLSRCECFGLTVTEAMLSGCAVVGTKVTGIQEQLISGITGILVDIGDVRATETALIRLQTNQAFKRSIEQYARRTAEQRFNKSRLVQQHLDLYNSILLSVSTK